jgi:hypothetical protein
MAQINPWVLRAYERIWLPTLAYISIAYYAWVLPTIEGAIDGITMRQYISSFVQSVTDWVFKATKSWFKVIAWAVDSLAKGVLWTIDSLKTYAYTWATLLSENVKSYLLQYVKPLVDWRASVANWLHTYIEAKLLAAEQSLASAWYKIKWEIYPRLDAIEAKIGLLTGVSLAPLLAQIAALETSLADFFNWRNEWDIQKPDLDEIDLDMLNQLYDPVLDMYLEDAGPFITQNLDLITDFYTHLPERLRGE